MARTYEILCHDCKASLWIGQDRRIYMTNNHLKGLQKFLFSHENHRLWFGDSDQLSLLDYKEGDEEGVK
jgi:hypothetical protein